MTIIHKYQITLHHGAVCELSLPFGAVILDVQLQDGKPVLWAIVNPKHATENRRIISAWTGHEFNYCYGLLHIKTLTDDAGLVWHIFEDSR